jgi:hypothetical protein
MVLFSLISFTLIYGVLMGANIYLMIKFSKQGLGGRKELEVEPVGVPAGITAK